MTLVLLPSLTVISVSSNLSWEPHNQFIIAKSYKLLGLRGRTFSKHNSINIIVRNSMYFLGSFSVIVIAQCYWNLISWNISIFLHKSNIEQLYKYTLNDFTRDHMQVKITGGTTTNVYIQPEQHHTFH